MNQSPFSFGTIILGGGAALLMIFLFVGFLLPGTWEASRTARVDATPAAVFPHLDSPEGWRAWTALPDTGLTMEGPARGAGAKMTWDHPEWGSGSFEVLESVEPTLVRYTVEVQQGTMRTDGVLRLTPDGSGTVVTWTESGDFGWNPLMGYWGLFMGRAQGRELEKNLAALAEVLAAPSPAEAPTQAPGQAPGQTQEAPADSVSTGA